jgi:hypothetical protein
MTQAISFDTSIPVLTEILYAEDNAEVKAEHEPETMGEARKAAGPAEAISGKIDENQWKRIEQELTERIMDRLQQRMEVVLERRMSELLQHALQGLSQEICSGLQSNMTHIVAQEMAQIKSAMDAEMKK